MLLIVNKTYPRYFPLFFRIRNLGRYDDPGGGGQFQSVLTEKYVTSTAQRHIRVTFSWELSFGGRGRNVADSVYVAYNFFSNQNAQMWSLVNVCASCAQRKALKIFKGLFHYSLDGVVVCCH